MATWYRTLNDAVVDWHQDEGERHPRPQRPGGQGSNEPMGYCFPHYFVLPMYSSASSYRFRPLGPEETLMEIWSLTRYPEGSRAAPPTPPEAWEYDDPPPGRPSRRRTSPTCPASSRACARGFEYMRLSERAEGHLPNFERALDGFLAGLPHGALLPALREVNVNPLERPVVPIDF